VSSRLLSAILGVSTTNKLLRKLEEIRLSIWLEQEMHRRFGSQAQAKREIFARAANLNYLGNGRYGFAAASEYYFGRALSSYTTADAGKAALLAGITKSPRDYAPVPGDPRPLRRRNEILALMARNGYISTSIAKRSQAEPVAVVTNNAIRCGPRRDQLPAELRQSPRRRISSRADLRSHNGGRPGKRSSTTRWRTDSHSTSGGTRRRKV
jgi:membrane peptidoglycan carboxypeptidase